MTDREKLEKIKELADTMYYAGQHLINDASRLYNAMDEYHKFVILEYIKEEPINEGLEEAVLKGLKSVHLEMGELTRNGYGRKWKQAWRLVNAAIQSVENFEVMNI